MLKDTSLRSLCTLLCTQLIIALNLIVISLSSFLIFRLLPGSTLAPKFWYIQTFQTKFRHVQTLSTKTCHFLTFATKKLRRDFPDRDGDGATFQANIETAWLEKKFRAFATEVKTARLSQGGYGATFPRWIRRDSGNGATQKATTRSTRPELPKIALSRLLRLRWRRRDLQDRGGDGMTKNHFIATVVETARLSCSEWRRRDFPDWGEDSAT